MVAENRWMLSGGIASGKSYARSVFAECGVSTIDSDALGHEVLRSQGAGFRPVAELWPGVVVNGEIDRRALGREVFGNPRELERLEAITHPLIFGMIEKQVEEIEGPVVVELPVLKELGPSWRRMVVDVRPEDQLHRATDRGMSEADARARIGSQPTRDTWLAHAELVLPNHGSIEEFRQVVIEAAQAISG